MSDTKPSPPAEPDATTRLALARYGLELGDVVRVMTLGTASTYNPMVHVDGVVVDATDSALIVQAGKDQPRTIIPWHAAGTITIRTSQPAHPGL